MLPVQSILQVTLLEYSRTLSELPLTTNDPARRVPERKTSPTCPNSGICLLNPSAAKHCSGCRLQKCLRWGNRHSKVLTNPVVTSVGMELSQVLSEDQRKERFSHSLQQKRAHKQMAEEVDGSPGTSTSTAGFSGSAMATAKAPKLETRTLLQKFLDGRKPENQPKFGVDSPVSEAQSQCTEQQEFKRKMEGSMKVRTDLLNQSQGSHESTKKLFPRCPTSTGIYQGPNEIYPYPGLMRHQTVIQPPQTWPNLLWGFPPGWPSKRSSPPNLFVQNDIPRPPHKELSTTEPDTTTPTEKLDVKSLQKVCDKDQPDLKLSDEKDKNIVRVYIHKKFRKTESSFTYQPPPRPSVIVSPKIFKEEKKIIEVGEDFDDILTTGPFSEVSDISDWCNVSDTSEEELLDITSICELYFSDESTCSHMEETQRDFFAEWTPIPLGEKVMETYIDFCKGNIKTIGFSWMALASSSIR